jgi:hypothetical protein
MYNWHSKSDRGHVPDDAGVAQLQECRPMMKVSVESVRAKLDILTLPYESKI